MLFVELPGKNITLIDVNKLFAEQIQTKILKDLKSFNLVDKPITHKDVKKFFYHHIIFSLTEIILSKTGDTKPVLVVYNDFLKECDLLKYFSKTDVLSFLTKFIAKLETLLPIRVVFCTVKTPFDIITNASLQKVKTVSNKNYTFEKVKLFAKRYELTFLNNDYLNRFKTKQIMI